ncbi:hypothetical protein BV25DRAFT_1920956 [Artomyces pyxidatus]|uniref:Uncharacterized protein n=1 Tax=Artomyces pyxidatus TaxID=48021 RepID=A0ACB8SJ99_9AGAM|nr:hypothetical protein BV25DRAFT_1920956 [Artomyces pyxidatus]
MPSSSSSRHRRDLPGTLPPRLERTRSQVRKRKELEDDTEEEREEEEEDDSHDNKRQKTQEEKDEDAYRLAGRWIPRAVDPFCDIKPALQYVKFILIHGKKEASRRYRDLPAPRISKYRTIYKELCRQIPDFKTKLKECDDLKKLSKLISVGATRARSDDASRLKQLSPQYAHPDMSQRIPVVKKDKSDRGFHQPDFARLLCPITHLAEYDDNPAATRAKMLNGEIAVTGKALPAFLYDEDMYDPDDMMAGLLRGYYLKRCAKHIFTGPSSVSEDASKSGKSFATRPCNAVLHGMTEVTANTIAYSSIHSRFGITMAPAWNEIDGKFSYEVFHGAIIDLFSIDDDWSKETLEHWNTELFGHPEGRSVDDQERNDENAEDDVVAKAKKQREMKKAAAAAKAAMQEMTPPRTSPAPPPTPPAFSPGPNESTEHGREQTTPPRRREHDASRAAKDLFTPRQAVQHSEHSSPISPLPESTPPEPTVRQKRKQPTIPRSPLQSEAAESPIRRRSSRHKSKTATNSNAQTSNTSKTGKRK